MKTRIIFALALSGAALFSACSEEVAPDQPEVPVTISANIAETRTVLGDKDGGRYPNYWSNGDVISVNGKSSQPLAGLSAGTAKADFTVSGVSAPYYAGYPASAFAGYSAGGHSAVTIPSSQTWTADSYDPAAFIMMGTSSTGTVNFHNSVCVFKFTPKGSSGKKVASVKFTALGSEVMISGTWITNDFESLTSTAASQNYVEVSAAGGVDLGRPWYIVLAPADMRTDGLKLDITFTDSETVTRSSKPNKAYVAGKVYAAELDLDPPAEAHAVYAETATSSTLSFTWTYGGSVGGDTAKPYAIGLYTDEACTSPVAEYSIPANAACWNGNHPRFVFGGLQQATSYWFKVTDTDTNATSDAVKATTAAFTVKQLPSSIAGTGVVLAEDFGEIAWDYDYVDRAAGNRPGESARTSLSAHDYGAYTKYNDSGEIKFGTYPSAIAASRLAGWAATGVAYLHPGHIKVSNSTSVGFLLTPAFPIGVGKEATVKVTITGARYSDAANDWTVAVVNADQAPVSGITCSSVTLPSEDTKYKTVQLTSSDAWETVSVSGLKMVKGDRIVFGPAKGSTSGKGRAFISDIKVEVESITSTGVTDNGTVFGYVTCEGEPVSGVVVSDGYLVTATDGEGYYSLVSAKKLGYVFISNPSGYMVPLKQGNYSSRVLPQFYKYTTQAANVREELSFTLEVDPGQDNHTMLIMGDMHLALRKTQDQAQLLSVLNEISTYINNHPSEKVYAMTLGDMTWDQYWYVNNIAPSDYVDFMERWGPTLPVFHTIGNHDHDMDATGDEDTVVKYRQAIGPNYYSYNIGKIHYMSVDNILGDSTVASRDSSSADGVRSYKSAVTEDIRSWVTKDLSYVSKSTPIVVSLHAPIYKADGKGHMYSTHTSKFQALFDGYEDVTFYTAHTHTHRTTFKAGTNIHEVNSGSVCGTWWWGGYSSGYKLNVAQDGALGGYRFLRVQGTRQDTRFKCFDRNENYQFRTYDRNKLAEGLKATNVGVVTNKSAYNTFLEKYGYATATTDNTVLINVWDYDVRWKVEASEDNKNFTECTLITDTIYDPLFILCYSAPRYKKTSSPTFNPDKCIHMFSYQASSAKSTVYVRVTDDEGRTYNEIMTRPKALTEANYKK